MTLADALVSVWEQALVQGKSSVELEARTFRVRKTSGKRLRAVDFEFAGHSNAGIEQNPQTTSRWAALAREGNRLMQFKRGAQYIANVCEGKLTRYPAWRSLELPE